MPDSVQPSRGLLSRWFGEDSFTPEMQQGIDIAKREMPGMAPVKPYGFFSRMLASNADAYTSPGNSIYLNPRNTAGLNSQEIADRLTHEQEHVKQQSYPGYSPTMALLKRFLPSEPYEQRPNEMAAFQAQKERLSRMGRPQGPIPSMTGGYYTPHDINLPR